MHGKYLFKFLLIPLLSFSQLTFAQESQRPKSREIWVKESIANLESADLHVAAQAAIYLGLYQATEGVPVMLRVLQSSRFLSTSEHIMSKDKNGMSEWVSTNVKDAIINSLGLIGDQRAVPILKKYLQKPLKNGEVFTGNVAHALYLLTGKLYEYKDFDGEQKIYVPGPITEEEFRERSRPDLKPTEGLTASLDIKGNDQSSGFWVGNRPLVINLSIANQGKRVVEIDASVNNFLFSSVVGSGERTSTPASLLPSPEPDAAIAVIKPGQKFNLRWVVETLKESPLSHGWIGYVNIKCVYTNPRIKKTGAAWRGQQLTSNSVTIPYYPAIK